MRSAAINFGDTHLAPCPIALLVPTLAAAALGYFMFFGRISDVYMGVITLTVTLILFNFINSTAGDEWTHRRGAARRLQRHPGDAAAERPRRPRHAADAGADLRLSRSSACRLLRAVQG